MLITCLQCTCIFQPSQHVSVKMEAHAVDQCAHVHLGTWEHCVRLLVKPTVQLVSSPFMYTHQSMEGIRISLGEGGGGGALQWSTYICLPGYYILAVQFVCVCMCVCMCVCVCVGGGKE